MADPAALELIGEAVASGHTRPEARRRARGGHRHYAHVHPCRLRGHEHRQRHARQTRRALARPRRKRRRAGCGAVRHRGRSERNELAHAPQDGRLVPCRELPGQGAHEAARPDRSTPHRWPVMSNPFVSIQLQVVHIQGRRTGGSHASLLVARRSTLVLCVSAAGRDRHTYPPAPPRARESPGL